jgi:hypothetical protein
MNTTKVLLNFRFALICSMLFILTSAEAFAGNDKSKLKSRKSVQAALWQRVDENDLAARGRRSMTPEKYQVFRLNQNSLKNLMTEMPAEFSAAAQDKTVVLEIPLPNGKLSRFRVEESQVLAPHLAAEFPDWKTFNGYGIDDPSATARFDWTSEGFHGYIFTSGGTVYIEPFQKNDTENYIVFYKHEFGKSANDSFHCKTTERFGEIVKSKYNPFYVAAFANGGTVRTYRIAVATTGEWSRAAQGNTSTDPQTIRTAALAALTTTISRLDGIYRRELSVAFQLVNPSINDDAANIIYDDPATDPYNNSDNEMQLEINQTTLSNRVGGGNYDIGHLYGTQGGGVAALGSVCGAEFKAQGYSARDGNLGDPFTVDYVAHEIGHQFGAEHTYNNSDPDGACTTRSANSAFEVASGATIMSYVGICSNRNLQQYVDAGTPSFHVQSLTQAINFIQNAEGSSCGVASGSNAVPNVNPGNNFTIPKLTPFTLTAAATDADNANLLYSWEQFDLAPSPSGVQGTPPGTYDVDTDGVLRPLFRSYSPVTNPSRTFPSLVFILNPANNVPAGSNNPPLDYQGTHPTGFSGAVCETNATCVVGENLPSVDRTMNFRVTVRDGRGGTADAGMTVTVKQAAGPFRVTTQDTASTWQTGTTQTVTWDVAGTDANDINAANVNILLSTDGGQTFPITLKANTPNDGSEQITVPNNPTAQARIKVEAAGNIFFDINNTNFQITAPSAAAVSVAGRILARNGRGIAGALVSITDQNGAIRTARASSSGYYRFESIAAGQIYTVAVNHKRHRFAPQTVFVGDAISGLNFTAEN